jgi:hypothetical protein
VAESHGLAFNLYRSGHPLQKHPLHEEGPHFAQHSNPLAAHCSQHHATHGPRNSPSRPPPALPFCVAIVEILLHGSPRPGSRLRGPLRALQFPCAHSLFQQPRPPAHLAESKSIPFVVKNSTAARSLASGLGENLKGNLHPTWGWGAAGWRGGGADTLLGTLLGVAGNAVPTRQHSRSTEAEPAVAPS